MRDSFCIHDVKKWNWIDLVDNTFKIFFFPGSSRPFPAVSVWYSRSSLWRPGHTVCTSHHQIYSLCHTCKLSDNSLLHLYTIWHISFTLVWYLISLCHTCILSDISLAHLYIIGHFSGTLVYYLMFLCQTCILSDISLTLVYYLISLCHACIISDISLSHLYTLWYFAVTLVY